MAKKLYEESNIYDIACAIREKCGGTDTYKTCDMPDAIRALSTAAEPNILPLTVTTNGTFNVPAGVDGYNPITVTVTSGGGSGTLNHTTLSDIHSPSTTDWREFNISAYLSGTIYVYFTESSTRFTLIITNGVLVKTYRELSGNLFYSDVTNGTLSPDISIFNGVLTVASKDSKTISSSASAFYIA